LPTTFGIGHVVSTLEIAENMTIRPTITTNSLSALKRFVTAENFVALIGEFAAYRELASGELTTVPIAHPLFEGVQARALVKIGGPLAAGLLELLNWIQERMPMFAAPRETESRTRTSRGRRKR
jgi:DNA-binding transcriptional LysR family regulator